jgi:hypothetical protein
MPGEKASLRDLVRSRAASCGLVSETIWKLVLEGILQNLITPIFPEDVSLDTVFNSSGASLLTWRSVINHALQHVDRFDPARYPWTRELMFDAAAFDRWLKSALRREPRSKRRAGAKPSKREKLEAFLEKKYQSEIPAGVTYKEIANDFYAETGVQVNERTVRRAFGRE